MTRGDWVSLAYIVTIVSFILALRYLSDPAQARHGNWIGAFGMAVAIVATFFLPGLDSDQFVWVILVMAVTAPIGAYAARAVKMTAMPQMVALFNGVGGGAAALIALADFHDSIAQPGDLDLNVSIAIVLSALIGSVSFAGSMVAFAKLQELMTGRPITYPGQKYGNLASARGARRPRRRDRGRRREARRCSSRSSSARSRSACCSCCRSAAPTCPSSSRSSTPSRASPHRRRGLCLHQTVLIVSGMLVGAAGTLLTLMMARAMGRSVLSVLFGAFGQLQVTEEALAASGGAVKSTTAEDVGVLLAYSQRVVVVPGYGLAVAQAQHAVRELADELDKKGVDVRYAIHPVAGRMPGHMNVLLAEANVPYDQLHEMDEINPAFEQTDVALVIGANDVTNPAARSDPGSPIYGMPILNVDHAKNVVVLKRSMSPGFAGVDNPLFVDPKTSMLFGDAKASVEALVSAVKAL